MRIDRRILIVDDNKSIHDDFKKILIEPSVNKTIDKLEEVLFQETTKKSSSRYNYIIDDAFQGEEAIEMADRAEQEGLPYALMFMDVRMPPGIDGVLTIDRIWQNHPNIEMVICSAYSDYSWDQILDRFGSSDKLLFVKKPFNVIVIKQLALSLITKWDIAKKNQRYMNELEREVHERTKELKRLLIEMKGLKEKAEEASRLKSAFLANMSHEIRSPMNSILGFTELLMTKDFNSEKRNKYLKLISNSGKSLIHLIDDIIHMAKIEAGIVQIEKRSFDLNRMMIELTEIFVAEKSFKRKQHIGLKAEIEHPESAVFIYSDPERIKQILVNLLANALKFTDSGNISFGYKINQKLLEFFVKDTGLGIPEDKLEHIFERFGQVGDERQKAVSGTGLGLTISKNLVELLGGEMWVKSVPDKGSTFFFTIPYIKVKSDTKSYINPVAKDKPLQEEEVTILVADDEEPNFVLLEMLLESPNRKILWAKNGLEAIKQVKENPVIKLILMDIKMPQMNGVEAMKQIKAIFPGLPILAQTAFAMDDDEKELLQAGFDDYIKKPVKTSELLEKVDYWLTHM